MQMQWSFLEDQKYVPNLSEGPASEPISNVGEKHKPQKATERGKLNRCEQVQDVGVGVDVEGYPAGGAEAAAGPSGLANPAAPARHPDLSGLVSPLWEWKEHSLVGVE